MSEERYDFDYEGATVEAIDERLNALRAQKESIVEELRAGVQVRDQKIAENSAQEKAAAMSPAERKALGIPEPQVIQPEGIASEEAFGSDE